MPKAGFKSITVAETIYDKFHGRYEKKKQELFMKGINSFSAYITSELTEKFQEEDE